jgi:hypothetical protein
VNSQQQIRAQQGAVEPKGTRIDIRDLVNVLVFGGIAAVPPA